MNFLLANSFTTFFNDLFTNWKLVLFIVLTILLLLTIFFKRFKVAFLILLLAALAIGGVLLTVFIIDAVKWDLYGFIDFLIAWVPTILFSLIVLFSTLVNAWRGRRKSLVLMVQSVAAAIVWVLFYYFGVQSTKIDASLVKFVNLFMGENGLQKSLGVSEQATTFRNILTLYFEHLGGEGTWGILLQGSSAYVYTIADMAYHIGFAVLCYVFYLLTVFILYLIYLCFYSERKYKKKKMKAFSENKTDVPYKKRHVAGGFVGLARGLLMGLVSLSFIGGCFYMVAGGKGEGKLKNYEMSGKYENVLKIYRSIESYGTQGIFMILNAMDDPADMPYYLLAADLVFSGELNDEHNEISEDVNMRGDLGAFTGFARDTVTLLVQYGSEEINGALNGTSGVGLMPSVLNVMRKEEFQRDFDALIAEFDAPTYSFNLALSLVNSVLSNIDSTSFGASLSPNNKELVKIMFKEGYLSSYIPEDCVLHDLNENAESEDPWMTSGKNTRPYLGLQQLVTKEDVRLFMKIFLTVLTEKGEGTGTFDMIRAVTPQIKELALFENGKSKSVDPVLARVYCYFQNAYFKAEGEDGYSYNALLGEKVAWVDEIDNLLDVAEDFYTVHDDVKDSSTAIFNRLLYVFDKENPNRARDIELYNRIEERVSASRIMGKTLATSFFRQTLTEGLGQLFENFYLPKNIVYENTFAEDGTVETYGELHYFLKGLAHIGSMEDQTFFELLFGEVPENVSETLSSVSAAVIQEDAEHKNLAYYASRSDLLRSVVSCFLIEQGNEAIYVPKAVYEKDENGEPVNVIVRDELEITLNGMPNISDFVKDCVDEGADYYANIDRYLDDEKFMGLIDSSRIAEGSLAKIVKDKLCDGNVGEGGGDSQSIIVPKYLRDDVENWCTLRNGRKGELKKFIDSYLVLRREGGTVEEGEGAGEYRLSLKNLMNGDEELKKHLLETVSNLGSDQEEQERKATIGTFLASDIIHYTVSDYLQAQALPLNNLTVVIPRSARNALYNDVIDSVVKKDELYFVFSRVNQLGIMNTTDETELLKKLITNTNLIEGDVLSASVVANMVGNVRFSSVLRLQYVTVKDGSSETFQTVGQKEYLSEGYYSSNPWAEELPKLLTGLNALFAGKMEEADFAFNTETMKDAALHASDETKQVCSESRILSKYLKYLELLPSGS